MTKPWRDDKAGVEARVREWGEHEKMRLDHMDDDGCLYFTDEDGEWHYMHLLDIPGAIKHRRWCDRTLCEGECTEETNAVCATCLEAYCECPEIAEESMKEDDMLDRKEDLL